MLGSESIQNSKNDLVRLESSIAEKNRELIDDIVSIPHFPLQFNFDLSELQREFGQFTEFRSHQLHKNKKLPQWYYDHHEWSFQGRVINDYVNDSWIGMKDAPGFLHEEPEAKIADGRLIYGPTPTGRRMPQTMALLKKISPYIMRTRMIKTPPGGGIHWHSHHNGLYQAPYPRLCIVAITLKSNPYAVHSVRNFKNKSEKAYSAHYSEGTIHVFNGWHDHEFWNNGTEDRWVITAYFNFTDDALLKTLKNHLKSYRGPKISVSN